MVFPTTYVWPDHIFPWADYKGATKSHLSSCNTCQRPPDENDDNKVEVEDHFVEVQEGPLVDENYGDNENNLYNQVNMAE